MIGLAEWVTLTSYQPTLYTPGQMKFFDNGLLPMPVFAWSDPLIRFVCAIKCDLYYEKLDRCLCHVHCFRASAPGFKECDVALEKIAEYIGDLDQSALDAISHSLYPLEDGSLRSFQEQTIASARQLMEHINPIRNAAKGEAENLGHRACTVCAICSCSCSQVGLAPANRQNIFG